MQPFGSDDADVEMQRGPHQAQTQRGQHDARVDTDVDGVVLVLLEEVLQPMVDVFVRGPIGQRQIHGGDRKWKPLGGAVDIVYVVDVVVVVIVFVVILIGGGFFRESQSVDASVEMTFDHDIAEYLMMG